MKTKSVISLIAMSLCLITMTSCWSVKEVGRLNLISVRNVDPHGNYITLQQNVEYTMKQAKSARTGNLEDAIDVVVKKVKGGEYLLNAKLYTVTRKGFWGGITTGYIAEGDVMGLAPTQTNTVVPK